MLRALSAFFDQIAGAQGSDQALSREQELQLATAVLLVEVARADFSEDEVEISTVADLLGTLDFRTAEIVLFAGRRLLRRHLVLPSQGLVPDQLLH